MPKSQPPYPAAFRTAASALVRPSATRRPPVGRGLGSAGAPGRRWVRQAAVAAGWGRPGAVPPAEREALPRRRRQVCPRQLEREVRKGAAVCVAQETVSAACGSSRRRRPAFPAPGCAGPTRTEADFRAHLQGVIATDPTARRWHIGVDHLDIHRCPSLGEWVADLSAWDGDLGVKGKRGVLHNRQRRAAFRRDPAHHVVFHDTPRHCSWLNQLAIWLSILVRKLLRRGSFRSVAERQAQVLAFIASYNHKSHHGPTLPLDRSGQAPPRRIIGLLTPGGTRR